MFFLNLLETFHLVRFRNSFYGIFPNCH